VAVVVGNKLTNRTFAHINCIDEWVQK
jgi:hypothetical protein